jgi:hypothetical protein
MTMMVAAHETITLTDAELTAVLAMAGLLPSGAADPQASESLRIRGLIVDNGDAIVASDALAAAVGPLVFGQLRMQLTADTGGNSPRMMDLYARSNGDASIIEDNARGSSTYTPCSLASAATLFTEALAAAVESPRAPGGTASTDVDFNDGPPVISCGFLGGVTPAGLERSAVVFSRADGSFRWVADAEAVVAEADTREDLASLIEDLLRDCLPVTPR